MLQNIKRKLPIFLMAILAIVVLFQNTTNCKAEIKENKSIEIPEGYTPIYTIADLAGINSNPSGKYILMNDIDMTKETSPGGSWDTGHGWTPLDAFSGVFDGNGHRIIGMHIYGECREDIGLFSKLLGGIVYSPTDYGYIGIDYGSGAIIKNLGIVDCDINVKVDASSSLCIGGIAGHAYGSTVSNCFVSGKIQYTTSFDDYNIMCGGIVGRIDDDDYETVNSLIKDCYNTAELFGMNEKIKGIGGIVGELSSSSIINCYNTGKIKTNSTSTYNVGCIFGYNYGGEIDNAYYMNINDLQGNSRYDDIETGCKALTDAQMRYTSSFTGFGFKNTWMIDELSSYPYPQLKSCPQVQLETLELKSLPNKTEYQQGSKLDLLGAVLSITYEDGVTTSTNVDENMISGINMDVAGNQTAVITYLNKTCTFNITVSEVEVSDISISKTDYTINRNNTLQLYATIAPSNASDKSITWESDNEAVATVTNTGVVRGINAGSVKITATASNGLSTSCIITVKVPAKSIKIYTTKITLKKGKKKAIRAIVNPLDTTDVIKWTSSNPKVASVNQQGVIKAKKKGSTTIIAGTDSGKHAKIIVTVR